MKKDYFRVIDTERKAYWLGLLFADGCINEYRNKSTGRLKAMSLEITLKESDKELLEEFVKNIEHDKGLKRKVVKLNGKEYPNYRVTVCCTEMCRDLIDKGCTPRKSLTLEYPVVEPSLEHHFIRGYFDGDGVAGIYYLKGYSRYQYRYGFTGTKDMLDGVTSYFEKRGFNRPAYQTTGKAFQFVYGNKGRMKKFGEIIYDGASVYMKRKHDIFETIADHSESDQVAMAN